MQFCIKKREIVGLSKYEMLNISSGKGSQLFTAIKTYKENPGFGLSGGGFFSLFRPVFQSTH